EDAWVNFKLYGLMGLTFLFALAQGFYIARHLQTAEAVNQTTTENFEKES
ncbi:MAG: septation protein IspZ, partial [Pseudomonadota bacterium]